eukprot:scaffold22642_cov134-Cylindrotheca_fusiformis.AAC.31
MTDVLPIHGEKPSRLGFDEDSQQEGRDNPFLYRSQSIKQRNPKDGHHHHHQGRTRLAASRYEKFGGAAVTDKTEKQVDTKVPGRPVLRRVQSIEQQCRNVSQPLVHRSQSLKQERCHRHSRRRHQEASSSRRNRHSQLATRRLSKRDFHFLVERDIWIECIWFRQRTTYFKSIHTQQCFKRPPNGARTILYLEDCNESEEESSIQTSDDEEESSIQTEDDSDDEDEGDEDEGDDLSDLFQEPLKETASSCATLIRYVPPFALKPKKTKMVRLKQKWKALSKFILLSRRRKRRASF